MTVRTDAGDERFALEYERNPKSVKHYREIAATVTKEVHVKRVLYLVSNYDLLQFVSGFFRSTRCRVFFGLERDWHSDLLDMRVSSSSAPHCQSFRETLSPSSQGVQSPQTQSSLFV